jgi:hypothetical protein
MAGSEEGHVFRVDIRGAQEGEWYKKIMHSE